MTSDCCLVWRIRVSRFTDDRVKFCYAPISHKDLVVSRDNRVAGLQPWRTLYHIITDLYNCYLAEDLDLQICIRIRIAT